MPQGTTAYFISLTQVGLITLGLAFSYNSCQKVLIFKYGIHQPRPEKPGAILLFMKKQGYPNENTFIFKDSSSFFSCMRDSVFIQHVFGALPFSPGRLLIRSVDTLRDSWPGLDLIPHLKRDTLYRTDTNYSLQQLMHFLIPLTDSTSIDTANADFIVVVPWAAFLGRYNDRLFSVREAIRQNRKVVIKPLFLCIDVQQTWEIARNKNKVFEFE